MIKTNIKMKCNDTQFRKAMEIIKLDYEKQYFYTDMFIIIGKDIVSMVGFGGNEYQESKCEEIDADLFIKTNGTCEETYLTKYTSQPKDLESALKKIENLHISLNKKVEKNKNQALEITKLLEQKKDLQTIANVSQIKLHTIEEQIKKAYLDIDFAIAFNQKLKDENRILKDKNSYQVHRIENLEAQLDSKETIISYLESKLK